MARRRPSTSSASSSPAPIKRCGGHTKPDAVNLDAFVASVYLPHVKVRKLSWQVDERIARQHLSPTFGDRRLADIRRCEVEDWLHRLASQGLAPATCNRILAVFKSICSLASLYGLLPVGQSPCVGVPPFQIHSQRERYLFPEEARRLMRELERSGRQEATALRLLLLTGARKSEILKARWENVRLAQRLLTVPPVQVRQATPYLAVRRGCENHPLNSPRIGLSVGFSRLCARQASLRHLCVLERTAAQARPRGCARPRSASHFCQFVGQCRALALRGAKTTGPQ